MKAGKSFLWLAFGLLTLCLGALVYTVTHLDGMAFYRDMVVDRFHGKSLISADACEDELTFSSGERKRYHRPKFAYWQLKDAVKNPPAFSILDTQVSRAPERTLSFSAVKALCPTSDVEASCSPDLIVFPVLSERVGGALIAGHPDAQQQDGRLGHFDLKQVGHVYVWDYRAELLLLDDPSPPETEWVDVGYFKDKPPADAWVMDCEVRAFKVPRQMPYHLLSGAQLSQLAQPGAIAVTYPDEKAFPFRKAVLTMIFNAEGKLLSASCTRKAVESWPEDSCRDLIARL